MSFRIFHRAVAIVCLPHVQCPARFYGRWTHRKPAKVLFSFDANSTTLKKEQVIDLDTKSIDSAVAKPVLDPDRKNTATKNIDDSNALKDKSPEERKERILKKELKIRKMKTNLTQKKVFDENNEIIYEKCKDNDVRIR